MRRPTALGFGVLLVLAATMGILMQAFVEWVRR